MKIPTQYYCHTCDEYFSNKSNFSAHDSNKHNDTILIIRCPDCPKQYKTHIRNWRAHYRKQHANKDLAEAEKLIDITSVPNRNQRKIEKSTCAVNADIQNTVKLDHPYALMITPPRKK